MKIVGENKLSQNEIASFLADEAKTIVNDTILIYEIIDSTNTEAKKILKEGLCASHGTVILAEHQTAGKGRLGRSFYSPKNTGIYLSVIYSAKEYSSFQRDSVAITVAAAVAVRRTLESFGVDSKIKWVNDIYVGNKKVCGILTEGVFSTGEDAPGHIESYIIGIGINVQESKEGFPESIKNIAGSMEKDLDRNELVGRLLNNLISALSESSSKIIEEYRTYSCVLNKRVSVIKPNDTFMAKVLQITDEAHLIVQKDDGEKEELLSGEISLKI